MPKAKASFSKSFILSITLHVVFFSFIFSSLFFATPQEPIIVNLAKDPGKNQKIVQATMIDKRAVDQAIQRQAAEEIIRQEQIVAQQRKADQLKQEAAKAQEALELANAKKAQMEAEAKQAALETARLEQQQADMKKAIAQQQLQVKQQKAKQEAEKQAAAKIAAAKQAQQAAALKAQHDRLLAQQQAMLESEVEKFRAEIAAAIEENRILSAVFKGNMTCKIRIRLLPDGSILSAQVIQASGNPAYDEMSKNAVYKSAPFAMPRDQEMYNQLRDIVLSFKNGESGDA